VSFCLQRVRVCDADASRSLAAAYAHHKLTSLGGGAARGANRFCAGVVYFVLMETLQGVSYWYIDQCESKTNQLLTVLGFLHICGQPYFTHLMCGAFYRPGGTRAIQNDFALRIAAMGGCATRSIEPATPYDATRFLTLSLCGRFAFWMRYVMAADWSPFVPENYRPRDGVACPNTEWIAASTTTPGGVNTTCTFSGVHHLAWSVPMYQPTYFTASSFIHCFVMFAPFFATPGLPAKLFGLFLFLTGAKRTASSP
jgi:hypothetical protein